jgi:hypothetical protein
MSQSSQFSITKCHISADRFGGFDRKFYDVKANVIDLNIYESLENPYLTATISLIDDKGLFEIINFDGTERIKIEIAGMGKNVDPVFERTFIMVGLDRQIKAKDNASVFLFSLIDEHAYISEVQRLRSSYRGTLSDIIAKISAQELDKDIDVSYTLDADEKIIDSVQTEMRVIVPNLNPIDAMTWLLSRATTKTGSPFYLWATIHDDNLRLGNLDVMLKQQAFNHKLPYTYNSANISVAETQDDFAQGFTIKTIEERGTSDTLALAQAGSISADYCVTNLNTGQIFMKKYDIDTLLTNLSNEGTIDKRFQNVFDDKFKLKDKPINEYRSSIIHNVVSSGTYGEYKSYHDEYDKPLHLKKLEGTAVKNLLFKNMRTVVVPGTAFLVGKAAVGDIVNLNIRNDNTENATNEDNTLDQNKSGHYLIHDLRHTFRETSHEVAMSVSKLERKGTKESQLSGRGAKQKPNIKKNSNSERRILRGKRII